MTTPAMDSRVLQTSSAGLSVLAPGVADWSLSFGFATYAITGIDSTVVPYYLTAENNFQLVTESFDSLLRE